MNTPQEQEQNWQELADFSKEPQIDRSVSKTVFINFVSLLLKDWSHAFKNLKGFELRIIDILDNAFLESEFESVRNLAELIETFKNENKSYFDAEVFEYVSFKKATLRHFFSLKELKKGL